MKKVLTVIVALLLVFILGSCTDEEVEITVIVYSNNPTQMVSDLEDLPQMLALELQELGYEFDRIVVQSSNDASAIESSLNNGLADLAIMNSSLVRSGTLVRVLDVAIDEVDHPDGDMDYTTFQKVVVVSSTVNGEAFKISPSLVGFNGLNVCTINEDESLIEDYVETLGATSIEDVTITHTLGSKTEVYTSLEDGTCDLGIVTLEDVDMYRSIWDDNEVTVYEELTTLYFFDAVQYDGFYTGQDTDTAIVSALVQSFIQISAHSSNQYLLDVLEHDSYSIPD